MNATTHFRGVQAFVWLFLVAVSFPALADDWPRWGGPRGDNTWQGPKLPEKWPAEGPRIVWRQQLGGGYGGIAVTGSRGYVMDRVTDPHENERVVCFNTADGSSGWTYEYPVQYGKLDYGNGPRATPTIHQGHVYVLGAVGHLHCLDAATGRVVWRHDLVGEFGAVIPTWGLAASPVVWKNLVIVHPGAKERGCVMAFDRLTGVEAWRAGEDPAGYATPIVIDSPSGPQIVSWTPEHILGIDPASGKMNWSVPYKVTYGVSIATPIYRNDTVLVTGYWEGSKAIRLGPLRTDAELDWEENKFLRGLMAQPLYRDGYVYSMDKQFGLTCFDFATGRKLWDDGNKVTERGRNPQATPVWLGDGDRVIILNAEGELILARLNPQGYHETSRAKIIERKERSPIWAHPAYAGNYAFARSDSELVCVELTK
jgi:outer membrane protein assembly factor BamB